MQNDQNTQGWRNTQRDASHTLSFSRRQPQLIVAGALLAGALLAWFAQGKGRSRQRQVDPASGAPGERSHQPLYRRPAAHMGATEEQIAPRSARPTPGIDSGAAGVTGAAYELDPASVTPG